MFARITFTAIATVILTVGAWAVTPEKPATANFIPANTTVIEKNSAWPFKGNISMQPCAISVCQDV